MVPGGDVTHFPGLLGPAAAGLIVVALTEGRSGIGRLLRRMILVSKPTSRFLAYALSPLVFLGFALVAASLARGPMPALDKFGIYSGLPPLPFPSVLLLVFLFNGYGEETGWRGFALERLQGRFGPVKGTLALAILWAGWHAPSFGFVEGYRNLGVAGLVGGFGLGICAGSIVLARGSNRTGGVSWPCRSGTRLTISPRRRPRVAGSSERSRRPVSWSGRECFCFRSGAARRCVPASRSRMPPESLRSRSVPGTRATARRKRLARCAAARCARQPLRGARSAQESFAGTGEDLADGILRSRRRARP